jgi:hypothetical protein
MTMEPNFYINFVLYAVLGRLDAADAILRMAPDAIRDVATFLARKFPITARPIYRGMLLDPMRPYTLDAGFPFISWSEDRDVAAWFADLRSSISEPFALVYPGARGYLAELSAPCSQVLFHHSWATRAFDDLPSLALRHPDMGPSGVRQIAWALRTQQEVITLPCEMKPRPIELTAQAFEAIARRLDPPWLDLLSPHPSAGVCPGEAN